MNKKCPACSCSNKIYKNDFSKILNLIGNADSRVVECKDCALLYLFPYVSKATIDKLYGKSYFTGVEGESGIPNSNADYEEGAARDRVPKYKASIELLLSIKPESRNILDVGAATGKFLSTAEKYNLAVYGVEYSSYAAKQAKIKYGYDFFIGDLLEYETQDIRFDLIHLNHVFEHLIDPNAAIEKMSSLLNKNGKIYIEVPLQFSIIEIIKFKFFGVVKEFDIFSLHHPVFYRPNTLRRIFSEHGYQCQHMVIFDRTRFPDRAKFEKLKNFTRLILSLFGQGVIIEAIFSKGVEEN